MDLDLKEGWEKKALIITAVIVIIIFAYAFNPFKSTGNVTSYNQSPVPQTTTQVAPAPATDNSSNNSSNNTVTTLINADQAKAIAESANKGYTASDPMQGNIVINGTTIAVWIVPMKSGSFSSKTVYVDITTGRVVQQT